MDFNLGYILRVNYTSCRRQVSEGNASLSAAASLYTRATTSHSVSSLLIFLLFHFSISPLFHPENTRLSPPGSFCKAKTLSSKTAAVCNAKFPSARTSRRRSSNSPSKPLCRPARARLAQSPGSWRRSAGLYTSPPARCRNTNSGTVMHFSSARSSQEILNRSMGLLTQVLMGSG